MSEQSIYILGLSFDYHDSAAALIKDGKVIAAAQEERFTREKQDSSLPTNAIKYCLGFCRNFCRLFELRGVLREAVCKI